MIRMIRETMLPVGVLAALALAATAARANDLVETPPEILWSLPDEPDLLNEATRLATPVAISEFVRNQIAYVAYHGARSSSINTFLGRRGNDVDIASTLIAMLRSQGIRARYAVATVRVSAAELTSWLGLRDAELGVSVLDDQGIQNAALTAGNAYAEFEHVWVQAYLPLERYRAAGPATQIDCVATPAECEWVDLAPAFKRQAQRDPAELVDVYGVVDFDFAAYYQALNPGAPPPADGIERADKNPLEIYEEQILAHLRANHPGKTLEDVADSPRVIEERRGVLPESLPFEVRTPVQTYDSVAEHDAVAGVKDWGKLVQALATAQKGNVTLQVGASVSLAELSTQRFTFSFFRETDGTLTQAFRLGGLQRGGSITFGPGSGLGFDIGDQVVLDLYMDGPPDVTGTGADTVYHETYTGLILGGYYTVSTGGETSNYSQFHRAARQLLAASQQFPIVLDPADVPYVDEDENGAFTPGVDSPLLTNLPAMDALTGGLLFTAQELYYARLRESATRLGQLNHVVSPIGGFLGLVSSVHEVEYLDNTAFAVLPGGLLIDMKGIQFNGNWRTDQPAETAPEHFELFGHVGSSLEHEVWQELTGFDALSTVRGIQFALRDGAALVDARKNSTQDTLPGYYDDLGFTVGGPPSPWVARNSTVFSTSPTTWFPSPNPGTFLGMDIFKSVVDVSTPSLRLSTLLWNNQNGVDSNIVSYDNTENLFLANPNGFFTLTCGGQSYFNIGSNLLPILQTCYNNYIAAIGSSFFAYFDKAQGFVPAQYVYRDQAVPVDFHDRVFVASIRNDLYLRDWNVQWVEYRLPSRRTSGPFFLFTVYLRKQFDTASGALLTQGYIIQNQSHLVAGGGYVNGLEPLELTNTNLFNNELLNDQDLVRTTNNDRIKTPSTADPVSTVTGNMYLDETDVVLKGRGLNLAFTRTYNSGSVKNAGSGAPLGAGWTHSYAMRLTSNDYGQFPNADASEAPANFNGLSSSITYTDERGGEVNYLVADTGGPPTFAVSPPTGVFDALALDTPVAGQATLTFRNGVKYVFDAQGLDLRNPGVTARLLSIQDPYGNRMNLSYNGVGRLVNVDDELAIPGRTGLTFTYSGDRIQTVADWTRTWTYGYDPAGNLQTVTDPLGDVVTYSYDPESGLLAEVILPEDRDGDLVGGDVRTAYQYYKNAKTFTNRDAFGFGETLDYDLYRKRTRVENARGFIRQHFYDSNGLLTKLLEPDGGVLLFDHNPDHLRFKKTDGLGFTTSYSYRLDRSLTGGASDSFGNVTREQDPLLHTVEYTYGVFDQPTSIEDRNGNTILLTYYSSPGAGAVPGKLQKREVVGLNGSPTPVLLASYTYYPDGNLHLLREAIDPAQPARERVSEHFYQDDGLNLQRVEVSGSGQTIVVAYEYDGLGRLENETLTRRTSATDPTPLPIETQYRYDGRDRRTKVIDALGNEFVTSYDGNGEIHQLIERFWNPATSSFAPDRVVSTRFYDRADRLVRDVDIFGKQSTQGYDPAGNLIALTDRNGHTTRYEYDAMNRRSAEIDANGHRRELRYDLAGRLVATVAANGNTTRFEYDAAGRRTKVIDALNFETRFLPDPNGNVTHVTDANGVADPGKLNSHGATEFREYDELNRLVKVVDALDRETTYTYDLLANRTSVTDARLQTTSFVHDDLGRVVEVHDPVQETPQDKISVYTYDEAGNRLTATDRKGQVVRMTYDRLDRLTHRELLLDGEVEHFVYDPFGDLRQVQSAAATYSFTYDEMHRLTTKTDLRLARSLVFVYDPAGNVSSKTDYQGDVTTFQYDSSNRLVAERNPEYVQVSYHYDPAGRLLDRILSNGSRTSYAYDAANRLTGLSNRTANGTVLRSVSYGHDDVGNITSLADAAGSSTFQYDDVYRLEVADYPGTADDETFQYDEVGNREIHSRGGASQAYKYGVGNRIQTIRSGTNPDSGPLLASFSHDDNGNVASRLDGASALVWSLAFDQKNRVKVLTTPSGVQTLGYDTGDFRVSRSAGGGTTLFYHLENEHIEAIYSPTGALRAEYLRGVVVDEIVNGWVDDGSGSLENLTFHHDHLRSVDGLSGHTGAVEQTLRYRAFGQEIGGPAPGANTLRYTGREVDPDSGLYYYRARYYDPSLGRFLSEDPLGFESGGVNFYVYVGNNPLNANDPSGLDFAYVGGQVGGASTGAGGSGQVAIAYDLEGSPWNPYSYYVMETYAGGGQSNALSWSLTAVGGYSTAEGPMDVRGTSGIVGGSIGTPGLQPGPTGGIDIVMGSSPEGAEYMSFEGSFGIGGSWVMPYELHGMAAHTEVQSVPDLVSNAFWGVVDFFTGGSSGAGGGFLLYPSKPNLNQARGVYSK